MAMMSAAAEPAVPGAERGVAAPKPRCEDRRRRAQSKSRSRSPSVCSGSSKGLRRRRHHVLLRRPVAEIDQLAAFAAKRQEFVVARDFFLADRALACAYRARGVVCGRGAARIWKRIEAVRVRHLLSWRIDQLSDQIVIVSFADAHAADLARLGALRSQDR